MSSFRISLLWTTVQERAAQAQDTLIQQGKQDWGLFPGLEATRPANFRGMFVSLAEVDARQEQPVLPPARLRPGTHMPRPRPLTSCSTNEQIICGRRRGKKTSTPKLRMDYPISTCQTAFGFDTVQILPTWNNHQKEPRPFLFGNPPACTFYAGPKFEFQDVC